MENGISVVHKNDIHDGLVQLSPITINEEYRDEWHVHMNDFVVLTVNGELINNSLFRLGGVGRKPDGKNYFMLLKYFEDHYSDEIMRGSKSKDNKHLDGLWCILDKNGIEKVTIFNKLETPNIIKNSCVYHVGNKYYNIETRELYCESYKYIESGQFIFIEKRSLGSEPKVMKINKSDGTYVLFE